MRLQSTKQDESSAQVVSATASAAAPPDTVLVAQSGSSVSADPAAGSPAGAVAAVAAAPASAHSTAEHSTPSASLLHAERQLSGKVSSTQVVCVVKHAFCLPTVTECGGRFRGTEFQ